VHDRQKKIIIDHSDVAQRLDVFLTRHFPGFTRSYLQNLITREYVRVNDRKVKAGYRLHLNDKIDLEIPEPTPSHIEPENIPIDIIYQDSDIVIVNKAPGMVVHPGAGNKSKTLVNALLYHCDSLSGINGILRPGIVHRLDKDTSGLLVVAKNDYSHNYLSAQFATRDITRTYYAIVWGVLNQQSGEIMANIDRSHRDRKLMTVSKNGGRQAITNFTVIEEWRYFTLLRLTLNTGRTHQIRVHLKHLNHPVFGDPTYNGRLAQLNRIPQRKQQQVKQILKMMPRQALHAKTLSFIHPLSKKRVSFDSDLPGDMQYTLVELKMVGE